jgi:3-oxoacyl-[acyl-carrier-protein] synthase-3
LKYRFADKSIRGVLTILPPTERTFEEEMQQFDFPPAKSKKLKEVMGYDRHRLADPETAVSDLCVFGLEYLFDRCIERDSIDALILVTQSPDYFLPPTSNVIQGRAGLGDDVFCLDINQGCAGFIVGLLEAFMLLNQPAIDRVVLMNADVLSRKVSPRDRNSYPLIGDAAAITVIDKTPGTPEIFANLQMDGARHDALIIPAGGYRLRSSDETAREERTDENNWRALDHLTMNGTAVFNFVQNEVPPMIESLLRDANAGADEVDSFLFHQPNRFMLEKLADKIGVPRERVPNNIVENFGNASGATVPTNITHNLSNELLTKRLRLCFGGFGVGLTWGSILMEVGPLAFCKTIDYRKDAPANGTVS